jgi:hypothetical protein
MRTGRRTVFAAALVSLAIAEAAPGAPPRVPKAMQIARLPATVHGRTIGGKAKLNELRPWCAPSKGVSWYALRAPRRAPILIRFRATAGLDATVAVLHVVRSQTQRIACAVSGDRGRAAIAFYGSTRGSYLVGIAARAGSSDADFTLEALLAERAARPPGDALPVGGVRSTLNPVLDPSDAWSVELVRGTTYRFNVSSRACVSMQLYRPNIYAFATARPVLETRCGGYQTFTPGPDGGGRYTLRVASPAEGTSTQPYLLTFAPAEADDVGPGRSLVNGATVHDRISGRGIDNVDIYRIAVPRENQQTTVDFREKPVATMDVMLLNENGRTLDCACATQGSQRLRHILHAGHYYVVVRSRHGSGGPYSLGVVTRDITATTLTVGGTQRLALAPGASTTFAVQVAQVGVGGPLTLEIQRFDPLVHWQFSSLFRQRIGSDGSFIASWTPPSVGLWRAHARFFGTRFSSFSESGWVYIRVTEPLG